MTFSRFMVSIPGWIPSVWVVSKITIDYRFIVIF